MANELFYTPFMQDTALQGYWRLEADGNDESSNGYDLTPNNTPTFEAAKFGNGAKFVRTSSQSMTIVHASCPNLEITGSQTWGCWFKQTSGTDHPIMSKTNSGATVLRRIYSNNTNNPGFNIDGTSAGNVISTATISDGVLAFICGIYDSANSLLKIWVNDTKTEVACTGSASASTGDFGIGKDGSFSGLSNGVVDEAFVFNRALSDDEVTRYYNGTLVSMGFIL